MSEGLDVIIVDDERDVAEALSETVKKFYSWGEVLYFTDADKAASFLKDRDSAVAVFIVDVFLSRSTGFIFLDSISEKYPMAYEDAIMMSGNANDDVVNVCVASNITHLLEKPVKAYALQLAVMSVVNKYLNFAKRIMEDPDLAEDIAKL